jgi:hypothetical protein
MSTFKRDPSEEINAIQNFFNKIIVAVNMYDFCYLSLSALLHKCSVTLNLYFLIFAKFRPAL